MTTTRRKAPDDGLWEAVVARDASRDGTFVFGVRTTGIYCRPSSPARRPRRARVAFFATADAAEAAGFRACRRCHPRAAAPPRTAWARRVCRMIESSPERPPSLSRLAAAAGAGPHHLQRAFKRAVGLSPKQYAEVLRLGRLLVAATPKGVSAVYMADDDARLERELREEYPAARLRHEPGVDRGALPPLGGRGRAAHRLSLGSRA